MEDIGKSYKNRYHILSESEAAIKALYDYLINLK
jgi:hypothetical protein